MEVKELLVVGLTLAVLGIGLAYAMTVTRDIGDSTGCASGYTSTLAYRGCCVTGKDCAQAGNFSAYNDLGNATLRDTIPALAQIPAKIGLIVTVIIAAVVIGLLLRYLMLK